jgi:hypothetical protein
MTILRPKSAILMRIALGFEGLISKFQDVNYVRPQIPKKKKLKNDLSTAILNRKCCVKKNLTTPLVVVSISENTLVTQSAVENSAWTSTSIAC